MLKIVVRLLLLKTLSFSPYNITYAWWLLLNAISSAQCYCNDDCEICLFMIGKSNAQWDKKKFKH